MLCVIYYNHTVIQDVTVLYLKTQENHMKKSAVILTVAAAVGITAAVVAGIVFSNGGAESIAKGTTAFEESSAYVDRESSSGQAQTEKSSETVKKPATTKRISPFQKKTPLRLRRRA